MRREGIKISQNETPRGQKEDKSHNEEIVKHKYFNLLLKSELMKSPYFTKTTTSSLTSMRTIASTM